MSGDKLVGIISRANLLLGLIAQRTATTSVADDREIKASLEKAMSAAGVSRTFLNIVVSGGVIYLGGMADTTEEKDAARVVAETAPGVKGVRENISVLPPSARSSMRVQ
jgi:osmotically-inducible protein OsmY